MTEEPDFFLRFWGIRGSVSCSGDEYRRYGGNTSCLEVRAGKDLLIFDAGSGLRPLARSLADEEALDFDIFLTHTHHDHIVGVPFFAPLFGENNRVRFWAGHLQPDHTLHEAFCKFMAAPLFPVPPQIFAADVSYLDFACGDTLTPRPNITLKTAALNHPNGATGYRIECGDHAICYVTDTEHVIGQPDKNILNLVQGADYMIYDSSYTDEEFQNYVGWGHSTWQEGARLCDLAGVKTLVLFHHDPTHDDDFMDAIKAEAEALRPGTLVAHEGMVLRP